MVFLNCSDSVVFLNCSDRVVFWYCSDSVVFFVFLYNTFYFLPFSVADLRGFLSVEPSLDVDLLPSLNIKISKLKESCHI